MICNKKNAQGVDHLDDAVFRWLNTDHGESAVKRDIEEKWNRFMESADSKPVRRRRVYCRMRWIAASSAAILLAGGLLYHITRNQDPIRDSTISHISENIRLTLPDGEQILLDPCMENGIVAKHGAVSLICENGTLIHERQNDTVSDPTLQWGFVEVPRGSQFDLILEDGTHVWLNADSRLRFPVSFGQGVRRVMIEGEGYFVVAHDADRPFTAETARQEITVSGTEFNVYAYADETGESTTLIEGEVTLRSRNNVSATLAPGQQAVLQSDTYTVRQIDTRNAAAWRDGIFVLDGNTFEEVFRKLSRWYDFTYMFKDKSLARLTFSGNLRRYDDAAMIFDILETIAHVKIDVKGNQVCISKKTG